MMLIMFSSELPRDQLAGYDATFQLPETELSLQVSPLSPTCRLLSSQYEPSLMTAQVICLLPLITPSQVNWISLETRCLYFYFILLNCRYLVLIIKSQQVCTLFKGLDLEYNKWWLVLSATEHYSNV